MTLKMFRVLLIVISSELVYRMSPNT